MAIHVKSEIGKLKKVMLHRPGQELEHLVPEDLERLLFDDIPYLKTAKIEHDMFAEIMQGQGVEVVYLEDLTAEVLKNPEKKEQFVREFIAEGGASATKVREQLYEYLMNIADEKELVLKTMSGIRASELNVKMSCPLVSLVKKESQFLLDPIPNLYFTRDPFACIGNGVSLNHMYSRTRRRETLYGKYILKYHPDFAGKVPFYYDRAMDFAIDIDVPDEAIITRMAGRRACIHCGATYHIVNIPPKKEGICDRCGNEIVLRDDDKPETVKKRLEVYHEQTKPLIDYYKEHGILKSVDGTQPMNQVFDAIVEILGA